MLEVTSSMLPEVGVGASGVEMAGWFSFSGAELSELDQDTLLHHLPGLQGAIIA